MDSTTKIDAPTSVKLVVPTGCTSLIIKYKNSNDEIKTTEIPVDPKATVYGQHDVSSLTNLNLTFKSKSDAYIDIYDSNNNILAQNVFVKASTTTSRANDDTAITIPEDAVAKYVTSDGPQTFYHSSGVAMFDDSWPNNPVVGSVDADFNDVVVDYDIEAKTVDAKTAPSQTWREQVKVVMHVRTMGGDYPRNVGLYLEGLSSKYIDNTTSKLTIGNDNTDEIPANSLNATVSTDGDHPKIQINNLGWLNSSEAQTTYYTNSKTGAKQLFNNRTYNESQAKKYGHDNNTSLFYNVNSGYINQGGDLFTLTVIFRYKDRASMAESESASQLADMIEAVTNTEKQNFYIITNSGYEIHLKGYNPTPGYTTYATDVTKGNVAMSSTATYCTNEGLVWGIKTPVLTGHVWEEVSFYGAYVNYKSFVQSNGVQNKNWYVEDGANVPDDTMIVHNW
ncbi:MAG: DUF4842 domain-containing protein [Bacteroidales bacterium]|nr:DUF4842 domain-containing protein [Bacteroidales bacterium]